MGLRTFRYRLNPTNEQEAVLNGHLAVCCELYNAALQERRDAYRIARKSIKYSSQSCQLPSLKIERPDVGAVYAQTLQDVLRRVDKAFEAYFSRVKRGDKAGYPRFRSLGRYDSLTYPQDGFALADKYLKLSKIGNIKIRLHRSLRGNVKTLTVKREAGRWTAIFTCETDPVPVPFSPDAIGIDVGLTTFATLSDGRTIKNPRHYWKAERKLRVAQRRVARRTRGSNRRRKAVQILQRVHAHVRNQRADFHHKESRKIINENGLIAVEDLNIKGLASGMLSKSVHDAGWSSFITKLTYKAEDAGRVLVKVDPRGTSQTCTCGAEVRKTLAQRWHLCLNCGLSADRDHVSAQVILGRGLCLQALTSPVAECVA